MGRKKPKKEWMGQSYDARVAAGRRALMVWLPANTHLQLEEICEQMGLTKAQAVEHAIRESAPRPLAEDRAPTPAAARAAPARAGETPADRARRVQARGSRRAATVLSTGEVTEDGRSAR